MVDKIFVDTGWFKGIVDKTDDHHIRAKDVFRSFKKDRSVLLTTNFVVAETFTLVRKSCGLYWARKLNELMTSLKPSLAIERVMVEDERRVWDWFWYNWRDLSYTDCTSFAVMKRLGLRKVVAFDEHFEMAGFEMVR